VSTANGIAEGNAYLIGEHPLIQKITQLVRKVAATDATVLIMGESGTGKELVARMIHAQSPRTERPFIPVNCGAIPAELLESEMFGHERGAFTGAIGQRAGMFQLANGGTIFLDEVGDLPPETQVKLLRVLQEREFERVGSSRTQPVNVRVIAATNRDLEEAVAGGRFRSDLFFRLNVFPLRVPPLRERSEDIRLLVMFFLAQFAAKLSKRVDSVTDETIERLMTYPWPGNIRELQNVIERAVILSAGSVLEIDPTMLPIKPGRDEGTPAVTAPATPPAPCALPSLEEIERGHILAALEHAGWVIEGPRGAAAILKLHPNTLRSRMDKLGIKRSGHGRS